MAKKALKKTEAQVPVDLSPEQIILRDALPAIFKETKGALIAQQLDLAVHQALRAEKYATDLTIADAEIAARATDSATMFRKDAAGLESKRKALTDPVNTQVKLLKAIFDKPKDRLEAAATAVVKKLGEWRRAEQERLDRIAQAQREAAQAEALRQAEVSIAMGDEEGAQTLLEDVQNISMDAPVAQVSGNYGSSYSVAKRKVGSVTDRLAFLEYLVGAARAGEPTALEFVDALDLGQMRLNQLAVMVLTVGLTIPGFKAELVDSDRLR